jgi:DNA-binding transcriptional LysR family regulator
MNIHHLELFYYVAKFGGISEAVRNIPYGIQQPAVSSQIRLLEDDLGLVLFRRRPFELTAAGAELYQFVEPFFSNVGAMSEKLRGGTARRICIGASELVLRDHLPLILQMVGQKFPRLKVCLRQGYQPDLEDWLQKGELDLAITLLQEKPRPGTQTCALLRLPLGLLVPKSCRIKSASDLWRLDRIQETLISLPANEMIYRNFQRKLEQLGVEWYTGIEVSSLELIETYVAEGHGFGLSALPPKSNFGRRARILPLEGFDDVTVGVMWNGKPTPLIEAFVCELKKRAWELLGEGGGG